MRYLILFILLLVSCEIQLVVVKGNKNDIRLKESENVKVDSTQINIKGQ